MREFVERYKAHGSYSQNGEFGLLEEIVKRLKIKKGIAVEFGACDGYYCSNTAHLTGWKRILYDVLPASDEVTQARITAGNVNDHVPENVDILSMDTDGYDHSIWEAYKGKAKVVVVEINSGFKPEARHVSEEQGASYKSMVELGLSKGYFLLAHTGNLVFILEEYKDLFPEVTADPITEPEKYFDYSWV